VGEEEDSQYDRQEGDEDRHAEPDQQPLAPGAVRRKSAAVIST
jgi:hypothetical protein